MRKVAVAAVAVILVGTLWLVASSQGGRDHGRLPLKAHVQRVSPSEMRLGFGKVRQFHWAMWAKDRPWSSPDDRVCFSVALQGPLYHLPNGQSMGSESGARGCGPIGARQGTVVVLPVAAGSITPPRGKTESWESFDLGIAAYPPSVSQVRLMFSDGESEVIQARPVPGHLAFKGAEPFSYALFAVRGCVSEMQGLVKGIVVVRARKECGDSAE